MSNGIDSQTLNGIAQVGGQLLQTAQITKGYESDLKRGYKWWQKQQDYTAQTNKDLADYTNQLNIGNWERQNEYNSPKAQMERYAQAGLNPDLIYSQNGANPNAPAPASAQGLSSGDTGSLMSAANGAVANRIAAAASIANIEESKSRAALNNAQADKLGTETKFNEATFDSRVLTEQLNPDVLQATADELLSRSDLNKKEKEEITYNIEQTKNNLKKFKLDIMEQQQRIASMSEQQRTEICKQLLMSEQLKEVAQNIVNMNIEAKIGNAELKKYPYVYKQLRQAIRNMWVDEHQGYANLNRIQTLLPFEALGMLQNARLTGKEADLFKTNSYWHNINQSIQGLGSVLIGGAMLYGTRGKGAPTRVSGFR